MQIRTGIKLAEQMEFKYYMLRLLDVQREKHVDKS